MTDLVSRNSDSSDRYTVINGSRKCNRVCSWVVMVGKLSGYSCYLNIIKPVAAADIPLELGILLYFLKVPFTLIEVKIEKIKAAISSK